MQDPYGRVDPPESGDERSTLIGFLDWHRQTFSWKCRGLTDDELRLAPFASTNLTLLGILRHLSEVENSWTRRHVEGLPVTDIYCTADNRDGDFDDIADADVPEAFGTWWTVSQHTNDVLATRSLDETFATKQGGRLSIRWLLVHLIEEYARHNGHADLIRQAIDGETGE